ncbi:MAG: phosphoribosylglycinamide formyltransferase [Flavobacteriia bacterium]|nr:phosphoribosylglycinamide formyltransferase [Flavobacteriia bacterium]
MKKINLAIFASGTGSNAKNIIAHFENNNAVQVVTVISNKEDAPIVGWCQQNLIPVQIFSNDEVNNGQILIDFCKNLTVDFVVLAGYLRKIPGDFIRYFDEKIINIHPSLLPKFGGKGMYGMNVHLAVKTACESQTGITIHFVNDNFDEGRYIAQFFCKLESSDSVEVIQEKIHTLEQNYFPIVIENVINSILL